MLQGIRVVVALAILLAGLPAHADCCRLAKVDPSTPPGLVRACASDATGQCLSIVFVGSLKLGESIEVCVPDEVLSYQEHDPEHGVFGPLTGARCDGGEIGF